MTREEEIEKIAGAFAIDEVKDTCTCNPASKRGLLYVGFVDGARWADSHPHWISVEDYTKDELPPLIDKNNPYGESVQALFVVVLNGVQYINKGSFDYDTGVWHSLDMQCSFCKENVTHWMPLTAPPKKGGEE